MRMFIMETNIYLKTRQRVVYLFIYLSSRPFLSLSSFLSQTTFVPYLHLYCTITVIHEGRITISLMFMEPVGQCNTQCLTFDDDWLHDLQVMRQRTDKYLTYNRYQRHQCSLTKWSCLNHLTNVVSHPKGGWCLTSRTDVYGWYPLCLYIATLPPS